MGKGKIEKLWPKKKGQKGELKKKGGEITNYTSVFIESDNVNLKC